jgi:hypothetical protein
MVYMLFRGREVAIKKLMEPGKYRLAQKTTCSE